MPEGTRIVLERISRAELTALAEERFGDMVKAVVDIGRRIMAVRGELPRSSTGGAPPAGKCFARARNSALFC